MIFTICKCLLKIPNSLFPLKKKWNNNLFFILKFKLTLIMGQEVSRCNPVAQEAERPTPKNRVNPDYMPIELFLHNTSNNNIVCWIMDNIGVLRSMFKIQQLNTSKDTNLHFGEHEYTFCCEDHNWNLKSSKEVVGEAHKYGLYIYHFNDGTAAMIFDNTLYYLHFEECPDDLFEELKKERPCRDRETIRRGKISQEEFERRAVEEEEVVPMFERLRFKDEEVPVKKEKEVPVKKEKEVPVKKEKEVPVKKEKEKEVPVKKEKEKEVPVKKEKEVPVKKEKEVPVKKCGLNAKSFQPMPKKAQPKNESELRQRKPEKKEQIVSYEKKEEKKEQLVTGKGKM